MGQHATSLYNANFVSAAQNGDVAGMEKYLKLGAAINAHDAHDNTALLIAAAKGDEKMLRWCLAKGAARDWQNEAGDNALLCAIKGGHGDVAALLLKEKFKADVKNHAEDNAMTLAATKGLLPLLPLLQAHGVSVDARDGGGHTPLMRMVYADNAEAGVVLLKNLGAQLDAPDSTGQTALIHATRANRQDIATLLLKLGAKSDLTDNRGVSAGDIARQWHNDGLVAEFKAAYGKYDVPQFRQGLRAPLKPVHTVRFRKNG